MLSALAVRNHPHLIKLLVTYKYKGHYHLVFPYANMNLRGYWDGTGMPHWNASTYRWFLSQICGLASGLNAIHNFRANLPLGTEEASKGLRVPVGQHLTVSPDEEKFGRHGDIKPENILWSNEVGSGEIEGILQIADMGLGRFHRLESRSRVDPRTVSGSPTYSPPEVTLEKPVSRAYDMWSLGCVFLEFITWLVEGGSKIHDFSSARAATGSDGINDDTFFTLVAEEGRPKIATVREGVATWITELQDNPRCSEMVREILKLVQGRMIVIDSTSRIRSEDLLRELTRIREQADNDPIYFLGRNTHTIDLAEGVKLPRHLEAQTLPIKQLAIGQSSAENIHTSSEASPVTPIFQFQDFSTNLEGSGPASQIPFRAFPSV